MEEIVRTVAKTSLAEAVPTRVADAGSARDWLKDNLAGADTWKFHPSALDTPHIAGLRTADPAMLALVSRLEAQQEARMTYAFRERPFEASPFQTRPSEGRPFEGKSFGMRPSEVPHPPVRLPWLRFRL